MRLNRPISFLAPIRMRYLLLAVIILGLIFFTLTYLGIRKARQSLLNIMVDEGRALMQSLTLSSNNAIQAGLLLESVTEKNLAALAEQALRTIDDSGDADEYRTFRDENSLYSIDILDSTLAVVGSDRWAIGYEPEYPAEVLAEIIEIQKTGGTYHSVWHYEEDSTETPIQYFLYPISPAGDMLVMATETDYMQQVMKQIGIGYLIREISTHTGIEYIILQTREGIVFSSRPIAPILNIENDDFLTSLINSDSVGWRQHVFEGEAVLEFARHFESVSYPEGVYRIGLNLDDFREVSRSYDRQIIIIAVILFLLTLLVVAVVSTNQNYFILDQTYRRMQSMTETIFDRLSSAVLAWDDTGNIIALNKALQELTGIGPDSVGKPIAEITPRLQFDLPGEIKPGTRMLSHELKITTPAGVRKTILTGVSSMPSEAGGGVVFLAHDISDQKHLEEENRRRERLSEMGDMAAGVAHEIRNPLNAISIAAQRLKNEFSVAQDAPEYKQLTKNILEEANRLNVILTRFLELARTRAHEEKVIDLGEVINRGIASVSDEARQKGVEINYPGHSGIKVRGSADKLQQVFINLIKNSVQAMPDGGEVAITIKMQEENKVMIAVADSGPGFPADALEKIFQPYFTTKVDGSGLGLALAYKTISEMGGTIEASNDAKNGGANIVILIDAVS